MTSKRMEKLIELLNEYNCDVLGLADHREYKDYMGGIRLTSVGAWKIYLYVFSKEYGFIKRLVDNDKINEYMITEIMINSQRRYTGKDKTTAQRVDENYTDLLLMLLSISENPIEDLISYLE